MADTDILPKCAFMGCSVPGRFTDPKLDRKMYCNHHRSIMMKGLGESRVKELEAELEKIRSENNLLHMDKSDCLNDIKKIRLALEQFNPFLKAMGDGDTVEMARTLGIINAVRDEYPL